MWYASGMQLVYGLPYIQILIHAFKCLCIQIYFYFIKFMATSVMGIFMKRKKEKWIEFLDKVFVKHKHKVWKMSWIEILLSIHQTRNSHLLLICITTPILNFQKWWKDIFQCLVQTDNKLLSKHRNISQTFLL